MRINRYGDRWNMELRRQNASNSDVKCFRCGCEFDFNENDVERQRSVLLNEKRGVVCCPCCGEANTVCKRCWSYYER